MAGTKGQTTRRRARDHSHCLGAATGTATMTRAAPSVRAHRQATAALAPVAIPSSTITAVRPWRETAVVPAQHPRSPFEFGRSSLRRWRVRFCDAGDAMTSSLITRTPPSPMAPMASSGLPRDTQFADHDHVEGRRSVPQPFRARRGRRRVAVRAPPDRRRAGDSSPAASLRPESARLVYNIEAP